MPLSEICRSYEGRLLYVCPFYGWGWSRLDEVGATYTHDEPAGPAPFHLRVYRFYDFHDILTGGLGIVEETGHPCDGLHAVCYARRSFFGNFTDAIQDYNIQFGSQEPFQKERPPEEGDWPLWEFDGSPHIMGYCWIAEDSKAIQRWVDAGQKNPDYPNTHYL